jgi:sigma-B regulation protein RsbU (phosphoserine phosphatase)
MWQYLLIGLLVLTAVGLYWELRRQKRLIRSTQGRLDELKTEESRVFEFLHGLGSAFSDALRPSELHRMIVEGAATILDAQGGALYLLDRSGGMLIPTFISKGCPPLISVPPHILAQAATVPVALDSYLRLHPVSLQAAGVDANDTDGILSSVWKEKTPLFLPLAGADARLLAQRETALRTESAMIAPLLYAGENLGVLALANGPANSRFTETDFEVFKAITEQSAFALYNAIVYSEVNEKKRLDHDLELARDIQRILLPSTSPEIEGFEISGINIPARQVSGDYFDYIKVDDQHFGIVIADVSGKGVPASLIMAMCRSVLRSQAPLNPSPADVLRKVNRQLFPDMKEDMFISMAYVILDHPANQVSLARAGHDAPLLYSARDKKVTKINPPGMALGVDSGSVFDRLTRNFTVNLEQNDCLILYTDGVTEALDQNGQEFGMDQMMQAVQTAAPEGSPAIVKRLTEDLRNFSGNQPQNDDITLIVIRKL